MIIKPLRLALGLSALPSLGLAAGEPVIVEAEDGTLGAEMASGAADGVDFIATTTDGAGDSPGSSARVASYSVSFLSAGTYQLYARIYVGEGAASDDSFFYGNGFGTKDAANAENWIRVNQLASGVGSTSPADFVPGEEAAGSQVWKWVMLSGFSGDETPINFEVPAGQLTQTFQIGAREDGLRLDRFAFGQDGYFYTVNNLDKGEAGSQSTPSEPFTPTGPPMASDKWKWLGSVHSGSQIESFTAYWNQVTPENAGKWGSVEGTRDVMNWGGLDAAYSFAKDNGFPFRFHILIWGAQQPSWISDLPPAEQLEEIEEWMAAVSERYPDIDYLEVVNEPLHQPPNGLTNGVVNSGVANYIEALGGSGETGWDWIIQSFELARKHFGEDVPLVLNDYGIIGSATNVTRYLEIVDLLMAEDLIDVISFQAHAFSTRGSAADMKANLDRLASRGLPIMITEMDVDGITDIAQLADYKRIFPVFWDHPSVIGVTLWGFRPGMWRSDQGAYLVLNNGAERPAMVWLQDYVGESNIPNFEGYVEGLGLSTELHVFDADIDEDGLSTGLEYLVGSNPALPNTERLPLSWQDDLEGLQARISSLARDGLVEIQSSSDLETWTTEARLNLLLRRESGLALEIEQESATLKLSNPLSGAPDARFYRIRYSR